MYFAIACSLSRADGIFIHSDPAFQGILGQKRSGVIVNVSSSVTLKSLPMLSTYAASKVALNAFTESLALELQPFSVRVSLVLPGQALETPFGQNAMAWM